MVGKLRHEDVLKLQATACEHSLEREALLLGIHHGFVATLHHFSSPAQQHLSDLSHLNHVGLLTDGSVPLHTWLLNARQLTILRDASHVFEHYLRVLSYSELDPPEDPRGDAKRVVPVEAPPQIEPVLVHLHPDFQQALEQVLEIWSGVQHSWNFIPLRPRSEPESILLDRGAISNDEACALAAQVRWSAGHRDSAAIVIFTEKRVYSDDFYQLYVSGRGAQEFPPRVAILSLDFLRKSYESVSGPPVLFRALLSNILFAIAIDVGLQDHGNVTRGCVMDFCADMSDIAVGLINGPQFCRSCASHLEDGGNADLLLLADIARQQPDLATTDEQVSNRIMRREP